MRGANRSGAGYQRKTKEAQIYMTHPRSGFSACFIINYNVNQEHSCAHILF